MKVILIAGKAQSGKDTTAGLMRDELKKDGKKVLLTHYADLLKYICKNFFDWNGEKDEKGRQMLQYVGTDIIRKKNPSLWVDFIGMILEYFHSNWDYVIIPDCRFPNEISKMRDKGFDTVYLKVQREGYDNGLTEEQKQHPSETALDNTDPDYTIKNNGSLTDLQEQIKEWIKENLYAV